MSSTLEEIVEQVRHHPRLIIADDYELALQRFRSVCRKFTNGEASHSSQSEDLWISLRILHRKRPGRAVTGARTREALGLLVENAFESARLSSPDPWFRFPIWKNLKTSRPTTPPAVYESLHSNLGPGWDLFEESYEASLIETSLRRKSERFCLSFTKEVHGASFSLLSRGDGDFTLLKEERAMSRQLVERADWIAGMGKLGLRLRKAVAARTTGPAPAILAPQVVVALLRRLVPGFYADAAQAGRSALPVEVGQPLFAGCLTLADHGQLPDAPNAAPFDMEGSATQETVLVDRGVLRDRLYDAYAATRENRLSTGNFLRRPQAAHPRIGASNLYFRPAPVSLSQLVQAMGQGWVIEILDSLEPSAIDERRYLLRGKGWRVTEGRCVEPVKNLVCEFDIFELFQMATSVGSDLRFYGSVGSPSIFFEEIPLSS